MASVFVEYLHDPDTAGYEEGPLNIKVKNHGYLQFNPKDIYDGRRVEELESEEAAYSLCARYNRHKMFGIATDLIASQELENLDRHLQKRLVPLMDRLALVEERLSLLAIKKAKATPKKKAVAKKKAAVKSKGN